MFLASICEIHSPSGDLLAGGAHPAPTCTRASGATARGGDFAGGAGVARGIGAAHLGDADADDVA